MYLIDTCIFSELIKKEPTNSVISWISTKDENLFSISVLTLGEIRKGIEKMTDTKRRERIQTWYKEYLISRFKDRLIPIDYTIADRWGHLIAEQEKKGRVLPTIDSLIAATALAHSLKLVTRNIKDFENLGLSLINPWD